MFHVEHFSAKGPLRVETSTARKLLCLWRIADGSRRPRCSTWNILSVADVPRGTFFRQRPFEGGDKQREKTPLPMENSGWLSKTPMFHVEHFKRGRCSTWNIFPPHLRQCLASFLSSL